MASSAAPKHQPFSLTALLTLIVGALILAALPVPYLDRDVDIANAFAASRFLAQTVLRSPDDETTIDAKLRNDIGAALTARQQNRAIKYRANPDRLEIVEPIRDIFWHLGYAVEPERTPTTEFAAEALRVGIGAGETPSIWGAFRVARFVTKQPTYFTANSVSKAQFVVLILGALPFFGLACIAMPFMSRFHVMNPLFQAVGFAGVVALGFVLIMFKSSMDFDGTFAVSAVGIPGGTPSIGMFLVLVAAIGLAVASVFGLGHKFWWLSVALYVVVVVAAAVLYLNAGTAAPSAPPTPTEPLAPAPTPTGESEPIHTPTPD